MGIEATAFAQFHFALLCFALLCFYGIDGAATGGWSEVLQIFTFGSTQLC